MIPRKDFSLFKASEIGPLSRTPFQGRIVPATLPLRTGTTTGGGGDVSGVADEIDNDGSGGSSGGGSSGGSGSTGGGVVVDTDPWIPDIWTNPESHGRDIQFPDIASYGPVSGSNTGFGSGVSGGVTGSRSKKRYFIKSWISRKKRTTQPDDHGVETILELSPPNKYQKEYMEKMLDEVLKSVEKCLTELQKETSVDFLGLLKQALDTVAFSLLSDPNQTQFSTREIQGSTQKIDGQTVIGISESVLNKAMNTGNNTELYSLQSGMRNSGNVEIQSQECLQL